MRSVLLISFHDVVPSLMAGYAADRLLTLPTAKLLRVQKRSLYSGSSFVLVRRAITSSLHFPFCFAIPGNDF